MERKKENEQFTSVADYYLCSFLSINALPRLHLFIWYYYIAFYFLYVYYFINHAILNSAIFIEWTNKNKIKNVTRFAIYLLLGVGWLTGWLCWLVAPRFVRWLVVDDRLFWSHNVTHFMHRLNKGGPSERAYESTWPQSTIPTERGECRVSGECWIESMVNECAPIHFRLISLRRSSSLSSLVIL